MDLVEVARRFAIQAHRDQRYGDQPYQVHLEAVVAVLQRFDHRDPDLLAAGWLHDCIEDCRVSVEAIVSLVGPRVAALVDALTDAPGDNRAQRKARPYRLIPQTDGAILVKLADRIANVEASRDRPHKLAMYRKEQASFRAHLYRAGEADDLWAWLDGLLAD